MLERHSASTRSGYFPDPFEAVEEEHHRGRCQVTLDRLNPAGLRLESRHTHVVVATEAKTVYVSGQVALDPHGNLVGEDDVVAQARQAFRNVAIALAAAGASVADVTKITWYVVNHTDGLFPALMDARIEGFGDYAPAGTLVGVNALGSSAYISPKSMPSRSWTKNRLSEAITLRDPWRGRRQATATWCPVWTAARSAAST
jgi:enamine deaminase RidA (YjgF/YER057c/UK114 family)